MMHCSINYNQPVYLGSYAHGGSYTNTRLQVRQRSGFGLPMNSRFCRSSVRSFRRGEVIAGAGVLIDMFARVQRGLVSASTMLPDGREFIVEIIPKAGLIGELEVLREADVKPRISRRFGLRTCTFSKVACCAKDMPAILVSRRRSSTGHWRVFRSSNSASFQTRGRACSPGWPARFCGSPRSTGKILRTVGTN